MSDSDDDELTAVEEMVARRLAAWDPDAELTAKDTATQRSAMDGANAEVEDDSSSVPKLSKERRRKRKAALPTQVPPSEQFVREARARSTEASESALSRLLVRSRGQSKNSGVGPSVGSRELITHEVMCAEPESIESRMAGARKLIAKTSPSVDAAALSARGFVEQHRREVSELGASGLSKKARKDFELRQRQTLGCRAPKGQRMPLPMVLGIRKKQREREAKEKQKALESGMLIRSKRGKRAKM